MVNSFSWSLYAKTPIVVIVRGLLPVEVMEIAKICEQTEFGTLEVTMNTKGFKEILQTLRSDFPNLNIGAGTVCNMSDLNLALSSGAQYIVTPILNEAVIKEAKSLNIPIFPGAFTPTEIYHAWSLGADAVKVFPSSVLGTKFIKDVLAPLDDLKLIPTGGVNITNINTYFEAGAFGVGLGGKLIDKEHVQSGQFGLIQDHFIKMRSAISDYLN